MKRILVLLFGLAFLMLGLNPVQAEETGRIDRPVWHADDAWQIKCPVMSFSPNAGAFKTGEYTVMVKVIGAQKTLPGDDCYVIRFRAGDDLPDYMKKNSNRLIEHAYYLTDTLALAQVERWQLDPQDIISWLGREVSTDKIPLSLVYYEGKGGWIPLLLPQFPLAKGKTVRYCANEFKDKATLQKVEKGENVAVSFAGDMVVEEATGKDALAAGAKKIIFYAATTYSKSGALKRIVAEQIWLPGKPWWSIARLYSGQTVMEYTLAE
jgi:hypothetical protein